MTTVRYFDSHGWHFAYLLKLGRKWAIVQLMGGKRKRVAVADLDTREMWRVA